MKYSKNYIIVFTYKSNLGFIKNLILTGNGQQKTDSYFQSYYLFLEFLKMIQDCCISIKIYEYFAVFKGGKISNPGDLNQFFGQPQRRFKSLFYEVGTFHRTSPKVIIKPLLIQVQDVCYCECLQ